MNDEYEEIEEEEEEKFKCHICGESFPVEDISIATGVMKNSASTVVAPNAVSTWSSAKNAMISFQHGGKSSSREVENEKSRYL